jgi:hypothetical protein
VFFDRNRPITDVGLPPEGDVTDPNGDALRYRDIRSSEKSIKIVDNAQG